VPPLSEQDEIVRRIGKLLDLAETIERRVAATVTRTDRLPQAILSKAFSGELVPTEAELARVEGRSYEPAAALLKRVAASNVETRSRDEARPTRRRRKAG
jgi:type I restriction enzyme S subunit